MLHMRAAAQQAQPSVNVCPGADAPPLAASAAEEGVDDIEQGAIGPPQ